MALILLWPLSPIAAVAVVALSHALVLLPTLSPNLQWLGPVVTRFETASNEAWLTIDDGPAEDTPRVLDLLERHGVRATFFVTGVEASAHSAFLGEILRRGHTIANHSQNHPSGTFWCLLPGRVAAEIEECNRTIEAATGARPRWFRAPVGMKNPAVHPALARRGMRLIGWTARGFDAVVGDPALVTARILPRLRPGAIIVLHQGRDHSLRVLESVIVAVKERGYELVLPKDEQLRC